MMFGVSSHVHGLPSGSDVGPYTCVSEGGVRNGCISFLSSCLAALSACSVYHAEMPT